MDNQNVGSHKMSIDSVFILFKKTDFNIISAFFGGESVVIDLIWVYLCISYKNTYKMWNLKEFKKYNEIHDRLHYTLR